MQGSNYHLPIVEGAIPPFKAAAGSWCGDLWYRVKQRSSPLYRAPKEQAAAFILGNEGQGQSGNCWH